MTVKDMVQRLFKANLKPQTLADALDGRVSGRTIYRWSKGESVPQQKADILALERLYAQTTGEEAHVDEKGEAEVQDEAASEVP